MKKLIFFLALILSAGVLQAQITMTETDPAGNTSTVNTNADTSYHFADLSGEVNNFDIITITIKGTKTSGTVGGAVTLWGSNDNVRWYPLYGASTSAFADTVTSQALSNGDVDLQFLLNKTRYRYVRTRVITTGTQVSSYDCLLLGRKEPKLK